MNGKGCVEEQPSHERERTETIGKHTATSKQRWWREIRNVITEIKISAIGVES